MRLFVIFSVLFTLRFAFFPMDFHAENWEMPLHMIVGLLIGLLASTIDNHIEYIKNKK